MGGNLPPFQFIAAPPSCAWHATLLLRGILTCTAPPPAPNPHSSPVEQGQSHDGARCPTAGRGWAVGGGPPREPRCGGALSRGQSRDPAVLCAVGPALYCAHHRSCPPPPPSLPARHPHGLRVCPPAPPPPTRRCVCHHVPRGHAFVSMRGFGAALGPFRGPAVHGDAPGRGSARVSGRAPRPHSALQPGAPSLCGTPGAPRSTLEHRPGYGRQVTRRWTHVWCVSRAAVSAPDAIPLRTPPSPCCSAWGGEDRPGTGEGGHWGVNGGGRGVSGEGWGGGGGGRGVSGGGRGVSGEGWGGSGEGRGGERWRAGGEGWRAGDEWRRVGDEWRRAGGERWRAEGERWRGAAACAGRG